MNYAENVSLIKFFQKYIQGVPYKRYAFLSHIRGTFCMKKMHFFTPQMCTFYTGHPVSNTYQKMTDFISGEDGCLLE